MRSFQCVFVTVLFSLTFRTINALTNGEAKGDGNELKTSSSVSSNKQMKANLFGNGKLQGPFSRIFRLDLIRCDSDLESEFPSSAPSSGVVDSSAPSVVESSAPSKNPPPSLKPSSKPSLAPSQKPSFMPSLKPSGKPSMAPSQKPSFMPSLSASFTGKRLAHHVNGCICLRWNTDDTVTMESCATVVSDQEMDWSYDSGTQHLTAAGGAKVGQCLAMDNSSGARKSIVKACDDDTKIEFVEEEDKNFYRLKQGPGIFFSGVISLPKYWFNLDGMDNLNVEVGCTCDQCPN